MLSLFCSFYCRATAISEDEARDALLAFVAEHCCYGKKAAEDMKIKDITPSSAYHVSMMLESKLQGLKKCCLVF